MTTIATTITKGKLTDKQIIEKHSPGVRARARVELRIVHSLIKETEKRNLTLTIADYTPADMEPYGGDLKTALFDLDEAFVVVRKNGVYTGWIQLIFGNDGYDLISDYSINPTVEDLLKPVNELADSLV